MGDLDWGFVEVEPAVEVEKAVTLITESVQRRAVRGFLLEPNMFKD
jgi:hypothetical protein